MNSAAASNNPVIDVRSIMESQERHISFLHAARWVDEQVDAGRPLKDALAAADVDVEKLRPFSIAVASSFKRPKSS